RAYFPMVGPRKALSHPTKLIGARNCLVCPPRQGGLLSDGGTAQSLVPPYRASLSRNAGGAVVEAFEAAHLQPGGKEDEQFHSPRAEADVEEIVHEFVPHAADTGIRREVHLRKSRNAGLHGMTAIVADHLFTELSHDFRAFRPRADQTHFALEHV